MPVLDAHVEAHVKGRELAASRETVPRLRDGEVDQVVHAVAVLPRDEGGHGARDLRGDVVGGEGGSRGHDHGGRGVGLGGGELLDEAGAGDVVVYVVV